MVRFKRVEMLKMRWIFILISLIMGLSVNAQEGIIRPDLSQIRDSAIWTLQNRELISDNAAVHLNFKEGDGILWLNQMDFENGSIELDIKGKDERGRSFVGLAFHGLNEIEYDVVYFRPFNFKSPERKGHSVQYISHPLYTWSKLRKEFPEKYENPVSPVPDPDDWFHVRIEIDYPQVKVYVNESKEESLNVTQLSKRKTGWIGFWVGFNSEGYFKNLKISPR